MASAIIGALRVVLGIDAAALDKGLAGASSGLNKFAAHWKGIAAGLGSAAALGGLTLAIANTMKEMDGLAKTSQKIGIPVEELSALKLAADLSDVSMEALSKSVGKLSKNMVEAAAKPTSEAANAFRALGLSVTESDGRLKSATTILGDVAGKFEGLKDGAGKTAVAMAIFGKTGADLIPLLNSGKAGLKEMTDEAAQFGVVISTKTAKSAEAFRDNLTRLSAVKDAIIIQLTAQLLPALLKFSEILVQGAKDGNFAKIAAEGISTALLGVTQAAMSVSLWWRRLGEEWTAFRAVMETDVLSGKVIENWNKFQETLKETERQQLALKASFENDPLGNSSNLPMLTGQLDNHNKSQKEFNYAAMAGKTALDGFIDSTKKSLAAQQADAASIGAAIGQKERLRAVMQALAIADAQKIALSPAVMAAITGIGNAAGASAIQLAGMQLTQESLEAWEIYAQKLTRIQQLYDAGAISAETYGRAMKNAADSAGVSWDIASASIAGSFKDISGAFGKESSVMAKAAQIFGAIQATISMFTGAAKALELPFPANIAAMAAVLAKGAMLVASIRSQSVPGAAMGGAFRVPGGIGGGDKVPFTAMVEPGEMIDITSNRPGGHKGQNAGGYQVIEMRGVGPADIFTGKQLLAAVQAAIGDGGRLVLAE